MERDFPLDGSSIGQEIVDEAPPAERAQAFHAPARGTANVSLPTVLRFEKNQRDIQLSSVLAILNVARNGGEERSKARWLIKGTGRWHLRKCGLRSEKKTRERGGELENRSR